MVTDKVVIKKLSKVTDKLGDNLKQSLIKNDRVATGETNREIESIQNVDSAQLVAPDYIEDLEFGKKPGTWVETSRIQKWMDARNISRDRTKAIQISILRKGWKGTPGVISEPLSTKNINILLDVELEQLAIMIQNDFAELI